MQLIKMTRTQRLADRWHECIGVYADGAGWWLGENEGDPIAWSREPHRPRYSFADVDLAKEFTLRQKYSFTYARRFWRRKKPKSPTVPKVDDFVTVRLTVTNMSGGLVFTRTRSGQAWAFQPADVDIVEVRRP